MILPTNPSSCEQTREDSYYNGEIESPSGMLDDYMLEKIFSQFDPSALNKLSLVCRRWRAVSSESLKWKRLYCNLFRSGNRFEDPIVDRPYKTQVELLRKGRNEIFSAQFEKTTRDISKDQIRNHEEKLVEVGTDINIHEMKMYSNLLIFRTSDQLLFYERLNENFLPSCSYSGFRSNSITCFNINKEGIFAGGSFLEEGREYIFINKIYLSNH